MKSIITLTALITVLTAAVITIGPVTSQAAVYAPDAQRESVSESKGAAECSLDRQATSAGCATAAGRDRAADNSIAMHAKEPNYQLVAEQNDASGALLEELVRNDQGRPEAGI